MTFREPCEPGDLHLDYCLWPYAPPAACKGKLRSASLLWYFIERCGPCDPRFRACCEALRRELGLFATVWGIKKREGRFSFELYFYDYDRLERRVSVERVLRCLSPHVACKLTVPRERPYFMFSLDLDDAILGRSTGIDELNLYIGNPGSSVSSGINYKVSADDYRLDNIYFFFDAIRQRGDIEAKVACSAHLDLRRADPATILWPTMLTASQVVVVANKQHNDGVYFSRMNVDAFIEFVTRVDFSEELRRFVVSSRHEFDHLLFDVGFDYVWTGDRMLVTKTAIYGVF